MPPSITPFSVALDALEREQKTGNSFSEPVAFLEKNLSALLGSVVAFSEKIDWKFSEPSTVERERMRASSSSWTSK
ncbi:MAG TPA: hypothetical protein VIK40_09580 [Geomonas sp.]